ncbi:MAG: recombinase RecA [Anaerolineae bacterium]|nr:MAG: recombinase RecA [Anaerolineae bacterium]
MGKEIESRVSTGIAGLDEILEGGLIPNRAYLVRGGPGTGKTTLGLHFLVAGASAGEPVLFISLEEPVEHIRQNAGRQGFDLKGVDFLDLTPSSEFFREVQTYDIFSPAEVERDPITMQIIERVEKVTPRRVFIDPITQFRYLSGDVFQFRRQVLSFLRFLVEKGATVLFTSEGSAEAPDDDLQFMSDGVIALENNLGNRTVTVLKMRGTAFRAGRHAVKMTDSGLEVYPRLALTTQERALSGEVIPSGVPELDELLNGGIERGTVTVITAPSGTGKTTLGLQFMKEAAGRGERSVVYSFEEEIEIMLRRCEAVNIPARAMRERGTLSLVKVEPLQLSADEFASLVRREVEEMGTRVVMIDSVSGFRLSLRGEDVQSRLHALGKYLQSQGVVLFLVVESPNVVGEFQISEEGISYLADNIIFLRYIEVGGEIRKAIGVLKKRLSNFERTLREFEITPYGIKVGRPLTELSGILSGTPRWSAKTEGET